MNTATGHSARRDGTWARHCWGRGVRRLAGLVLAVSLCLCGGGAALASGGGTIIQATEGVLFSGQVAVATCPDGPPAGTFTITWGDGSDSAAQTTISGEQVLISGSHTYAEEGPYSGSVAGKLICGTSGQGFSATFTGQVADAKLTGTVQLASAMVGKAFSGTVATFTDPDPLATVGDYSAVISWGDGSKSVGLISPVAAGFAVQGSHTYVKVGGYPLAVTISDAGGATATPSGTVSVTAVARARFTLPATVKAGRAALFDATASHPAGQKVSSFQWSVRGPGVLGGAVTANCGGDTSQLRTSFHRNGVVTARLTVRYASGAVSTITHRLDVAAARIGPIASWAVGHVGQWTMCVRGSGDPGIVPVSDGGPPQGCQDEYKVGLIDAIGCFTVLSSYSQIPKPEYQQLCPYFANLQICRASSIVPGLGAGVIGSGAIARTVPDGSCVRCQLHEFHPLPPVMSIYTVRINGMDVTPAAGAAIVLDLNDGAMATSDAEFSLLDGELAVHDGPMVTSMFNVNGDLPLLDADLSQLESSHPGLARLLDLGGFQLSGTLTVDLVNRATRIGASLTLPSSFTDPGGGSATSTLTARADNQNGLVLDDLLLNVPSANFGALAFDNLSFCYQAHISEGFCQQQTGADFGNLDGTGHSSWNATGEVNILGTDISAVPPPPDQGIGFVDGNFDFGGLTVGFPDPGIPLGNSGVSLTTVGASLGVNPTRFGGSIGLNAADIVSINGAVFMVFGPYTFIGNELGASIKLPKVTTPGFAIAAGGSVGLKLPIVGTDYLANGYVLYVAPSYLAVAGNIHFDPLDGLLVLDGGVSGQFSLQDSAFNIAGHLHVSVPIFSVDAQAVLSSRGVGVCGSIHIDYLIGSADIGAGAGYRWGDTFPSFWLGSCDLGPYTAAVPAVSFARAAAQNRFRLHLPAGLPSEMIKLPGKGGAPDITITGPGGVQASTNGGASAAVKPFVIYRVAKLRTTYIAIIKPSAGTYTIKANSGSPAIARILRADGVTPSVRATLSRHHGTMLLRYRIRRIPGQHVVFAERSSRLFKTIGIVKEASGTLRFRPAPGLGGPRQIVAQIVQNGAPIMLSRGPAASSELVVARYRAPGPRELARVAHLQVRHTGTRLLVRFGHVTGAVGYSVTIALSSGQREVFRTTQARLTVRGVFGEITGQVSARALGNNTTVRTGPAVRVRFRRALGD